MRAELHLNHLPLPRVATASWLLLLLLWLHPVLPATAAEDEIGVPSTVPGIQEQFSSARQCVDAWLGKGRLPSEHLAAVYLHAHLQPSARDTMLHCSIRQLLTNIGAKTPLHVFVFVRDSFHARLKEILAQGLGEDARRVCVLPISISQWMHHPLRHMYQQELNGKYQGDYVRMGLWRMMVPYNIISDLGYPYYLQVDDDLFVHKPLQYNIVVHMRANNFTITTHRMPVEYWHVMYGLPELAVFYLRSNGLTCGTSMFEHVVPNNMSGVYSPTQNWWRNPVKIPKLGYDLVHLYGNFFIMSTQLWADERVQDWINMCIHSGGLERHRWQEQGVMTFVWLLFTDKHNLWYLKRDELAWIHTRRISRLKHVCPQLQKQVGARRLMEAAAAA